MNNRMIREVTKKLLLLMFYKLRPTDKKAARGLLVLTYHRISELPDPTDPLKVAVSTFENQIRFLKANYTIISANDLADAITGVRQLPNKSCLITFDDGWQDNYTLGFPILKKYCVPALIFVSTDYIGTDKIFWHVRLRNILKQEMLGSLIFENIGSNWSDKIAEKCRSIYRLPVKQRNDLIDELIECMKVFPLIQIEKLISSLEGLCDPIATENDGAMLSWEQVTEMSKSGISFGSHAKSHSILTHLDESKVKDEIIGSKRMLETRLSQAIHFIAYPNGDYDQSTLRIAKEARFWAGFTCKLGINRCLDGLLELKRINMRENSASGFSGTFSPLFYKVELSGIRFRLKEIISAILSKCSTVALKN